jgi:hypothetical protein
MTGEVYKCLQQSGKVSKINFERLINLIENIYLSKFVCSDITGSDLRKFGHIKNG